MTYRVKIWRAAQRDLKAFRGQERARIVTAIKSLEEDPTDRPDVKSLKEISGFFRLRVGNYRIVFRIEREEVQVALIGNRRDIYEKLRQRF